MTDSVYLAKCIYNKGCDAESVLTDLPEYLQYDGTIGLSKSSDCSALDLKGWRVMDITYECSGMTDLEFIDYPYLESVIITGNYKYDYSKSLTLQSL